MKNNLFNTKSIEKYTNKFILTSQKRSKLERYIDTDPHIQADGFPELEK